MTSEARVRLIRQTLVVLDRVSAAVCGDPAREADPVVVEALNLANLVADEVVQERQLSGAEYSQLPTAEKWLEVFGGGTFGGVQ